MAEQMAKKLHGSLQEIRIEIDWRRQSNTCSSAIFRVPPNLHEVDEDAFTPKIVSLGPFHRKKESLREMEHLKLLCLQRFLERIASPEQGTLERCIYTITEVKSEAWDCYSGKIDMDSQEFVEMLLLDCCFILEVLLNPSEVLDTPSLYMLVSLDMLMLENQIPLLILERLYSLVKADGNLVEKLVFGFAKDFLPDNFTYRPSPDAYSKPRHLLHQIHSWMVPSQAAYEDRPSRIRRHNLKKDVVSEGIASAVELKNAGVKLKRKIKGSPLEVRFKKGVLQMSQLKIYDHTRFLLRNLVALEHCYLPCGRYVTDYVFFVDRLIDTPGDVALLHDRGVVVNGLGSDEEAAQLVNSLSRNMVWDSGNNELHEVFRGINDHCRRRRSRWRAKFMRRECFGSPLAVMVLLTACAIFIITLLQTIYTVRSYYKI